ncbi:hypothetical protein V1525DRAFT_407263 [Lipomyces kononenkoae]|uniref:Uncharacterized protein n=1 Tax=Lipomyces kononenkoae TaxID=34357 RepID=A0ACC3SXH3_LIPKO
MATNDMPNSSDQLAAPLIHRHGVPSPPPLSTESVSSSGLATPLSALSTGDVADDADLSEPSTAGSATSGYLGAANVPSRPESRSSTLSGISTTAVKDGIEGRRVHHRSVEIKPSIVTAQQHHHHHHSNQGGSNFQHTSRDDMEQSQSSTSDSHRSTSQTPTSSSTSSSNADDLDRSLQELSAGSKPLYDDYEEYTNRLTQT